jgi:hypothetical protein
MDEETNTEIGKDVLLKIGCECECGSKRVNDKNKNRHLKTNKHQLYLLKSKMLDDNNGYDPLFYIDNPLHEDLTSSENKILPEKD